MKKDNPVELLQYLLIQCKNHLINRESIPRNRVARFFNCHVIILDVDIHIFNQLVEILLEDYKHKYQQEEYFLPVDLVCDMVLKSLENAIKQEISPDKCWMGIVNNCNSSTLKKIILIKSVTINLSIVEPVRIIDLEFSINMLDYIDKKYPANSSIARQLLKEEFFENKDIFNQHMPSVGVCAEILAFNESEANHKFTILSKEVIGFLKIFDQSGKVQFFKQKNLSSEQTYRIIDGVHQGASSHVTNLINRVHIDSEWYQQLKCKGGLNWLNNWREHTDHTKAHKMKRALYWYANANDQLDITLKLVMLINILECVLKFDHENTKISSTIADRVAFLLYEDKELRMKIYNKMKKIYGLRSKIVHRGFHLCIKDEFIVGETAWIVKQVLIAALEILAQENQSFEDFITVILDKKFG